jgi:hypothetical protein
VCKHKISKSEPNNISVVMLVAGPDDKIHTVNDPELLETCNASYWTWESRSHVNPDTGLPYYEGGWTVICIYILLALRYMAPRGTLTMGLHSSVT